MIELTAAMVGDVDDLDAMIERDLGILGGTDSFDGESDLVSTCHPLDGAPVERHLKVAALHPAAAGCHMTFGQIALAPAVVGGVDSHAERRVIVFDGALDMIVGPGGVAAHIELK